MLTRTDLIDRMIDSSVEGISEDDRQIAREAIIKKGDEFILKSLDSVGLHFEKIGNYFIWKS